MTTHPLVGPTVRTTTIAVRRAVAIVVLVVAIALAFAIGRSTADATAAGSAPHPTRSAAPAADHHFDGCHFGRPC